MSDDDNSKLFAQPRVCLDCGEKLVGLDAVTHLLRRGQQKPIAGTGQ
jgi:hypothetical protein